MTADEQPKQVNSWFNLLYNINTKVTYSSHSELGTIDITNSPYAEFSGYTHPIIRLVFADGGVELMDHSQLSTSTGGGTGDDEYQYFQKSNVSVDSSENRVLTQDIGAKTFLLGGGKWLTQSEGEPDETDWLEDFGGCNSLGYINTTSLQVYKRAILKDFNSKDLYAYAEGRVDDVNGRYTGIEIVVLSGQSDIVIRQEQGVSSRRLTPASRTKAKVISSKTIKKITKGGY